jgi:hypothetical protein
MIIRQGNFFVAEAQNCNPRYVQLWKKDVVKFPFLGKTPKILITTSTSKLPTRQTCCIILPVNYGKRNFRV